MDSAPSCCIVNSFFYDLILLLVQISWQIVEFIAVLLRANSEGARHELVSSGAIQLVLKLFFEYVYHFIIFLVPSHLDFGMC